MFIITNVSHKDIKINGKAIHIGESRKFESIDSNIKSLASHRLIVIEETVLETPAESSTKSVKENSSKGSTTKILTEEGTSNMRSATKILNE